MHAIKSLGLNEDGQAFLESVMTLGIFILILLGVLQFGVVTQARQRCYAAARHGARMASADDYNANALKNFFTGPDGSTTTFRDPSKASPSKSGDADWGVTVEVDYEVERLPFMPPIIAGTSPMRLGRPMEGVRIDNCKCKMMGDVWDWY